METIDLTPTWESILPTLLLLYRDAKQIGKDGAVEELKRMAAAADKYIELQKSHNKVSALSGTTNCYWQLKEDDKMYCLICNEENEDVNEDDVCPICLSNSKEENLI